MMKLNLKRRLAPLALTATLVAGAALSVPPTFAQKVSAPQKDLQTRTQNRVAETFAALESRVESLGLSGAQKSKLMSIAQKNGPLLPAIWNGSPLTRVQKKSRFGGVSREINAVFTPTQKQKIAAAKRESVGQLIGAVSWISGELALDLTQQNQMQQIAMTVYRRARVADANSQFTRVLTPPQKMKWSVIQRAAQQEILKRARVWRELNLA